MVQRLPSSLSFVRCVVPEGRRRRRGVAARRRGAHRHAGVRQVTVLQRMELGVGTGSRLGPASG